jgi:hypothetical protein
MDFLIGYIVFALTTALCAWLFYYMPIVRLARANGISNTFTDNPILSTIVYIVISTVVAPGVFMALFSETKSKLFLNALKEEIFKAD